jgi:hypothetical protein
MVITFKLSCVSILLSNLLLLLVDLASNKRQQSYVDVLF